MHAIHQVLADANYLGKKKTSKNEWPSYALHALFLDVEVFRDNLIFKSMMLLQRPCTLEHQSQ